MTKNINSTIDNYESRERNYCKKAKRILGLEKGRNSSGYVGDKYWYKVKEDVLFVQIHRIIPKYNNVPICLNTGIPGDKHIYKVLISSDKISSDDSFNVIAE